MQPPPSFWNFFSFDYTQCCLTLPYLWLVEVSRKPLNLYEEVGNDESPICCIFLVIRTRCPKLKWQRDKSKIKSAMYRFYVFKIAIAFQYWKIAIAFQYWLSRMSFQFFAVFPYFLGDSCFSLLVHVSWTLKWHHRKRHP